MNYVLAWFARNNVAANLLMVTIIVGGLLMISRLKVEIFPEFETDLVIITVPYLGAAPAEVEEAVCVRVEEAIQGPGRHQEAEFHRVGRSRQDPGRGGPRRRRPHAAP